MYRWLLVLVLAVASSTARADSSSLTDTTTRAWNTAVAAEQALARATARWTELNAKFRGELDEVTKLKNAPRSWRRDRNLQAKMSDADATGQQLRTVTADVRTATDQLATARRAVVAAIDAELAAKPTGPRLAQLQKARAQVAPQGSKAKRIVLPDTNIDPLADPEDLDQQAIAIRDGETELQNQIAGLESQAKELDRIAALRKQHDRTQELDRRDDNSTRKGSTPTGGRGATDAAVSPETPGAGAANPTSLEDAKITLADVVDPNTIAELDRAQRSNDPTKRAAAARLARDAVQRRLRQLQDKRKQVEDRAASLRKR